MVGNSSLLNGIMQIGLLLKLRAAGRTAPCGGRKPILIEDGSGSAPNEVESVHLANQKLSRSVDNIIGSATKC